MFVFLSAIRSRRKQFAVRLSQTAASLPFFPRVHVRSTRMDVAISIIERITPSYFYTYQLMYKLTIMTLGYKCFWRACLTCMRSRFPCHCGLRAVLCWRHAVHLSHPAIQIHASTFSAPFTFTHIAHCGLSLDLEACKGGACSELFCHSVLSKGPLPRALTSPACAPVQLRRSLRLFTPSPHVDWRLEPMVGVATAPNSAGRPRGPARRGVECQAHAVENKNCHSLMKTHSPSLTHARMHGCLHACRRSQSSATVRRSRLRSACDAATPLGCCTGTLAPTLHCTTRLPLPP